MTPSDVLQIVAQTTFRPFTKTDWDAFAGCESENPLLGEATPPPGSVCSDGDPVSVVVDGDVINVIASDGIWYGFKLEEL